MSISRETVVWGFRLILGREPESEEGIRAHMRLGSEAELVETLLRSPEFRASGRFGRAIELREQGADNKKIDLPHVSRASLSAVVFGNCQAATIAELIQAMTGGTRPRSYETTAQFLSRVRSGEIDLKALLEGVDLVIVQMVGELTQMIRAAVPRLRDRIRQMPPLNYNGFHPDCVYVARKEGGYLRGPMGEYHSSLAFWAWQNGHTAAQATDLFRADVYEALSFFDYHPSARRILVANAERCELHLSPLLDEWLAQGCFMHTVNHPKVHALAGMVELALRREGIEPMTGNAAWVEDRLARWPVWPVYPEIAQLSGLPGGHLFKLDRGFCPESRPVLTMDLPDFVEHSFAAFESAPAGGLSCERVASTAYQGLGRFVRQAPSRWSRLADKVQRILPSKVGEKATPQADSPYSGLPDYQFWRRAVERPALEDLDPVVRTNFAIGREDKVATAGSCFAQHIAKALHRDGFTYMVIDADPKVPVAQAQQRGFGMYSARYGNVYTARQLVQLFDRAHGAFTPLDKAWKRSDGRYVDPFRPQIEPEGFATQAEVVRETRKHLQDVGRLFAELDVFVFTLGLTEAWRRRADGAVFPLAPGVVAGALDRDLYEFVNFDGREVLSDLQAFLLRLRGVNPSARVILTVSPVPLIATYEDRHVLVSTTHSKAVLRAAAGKFAEAARGVDYFPSYEIITGPASRGLYYDDDLRSIRPEGVAHVMKVFFRHYAPGEGEAAVSPHAAPASRRNPSDAEREASVLDGIVCDEEALDRPPPAAR